MVGKEIYKIWAPKSKWMGWVRPVPFVELNLGISKEQYVDFNLDEVIYLKDLTNTTAVVIDLPGIESVKEGISLAKHGFRPVPIYNGTSEQKGSFATVDNSALEFGLIMGAQELKKINIAEDAMPVFLLDSNRMNRFKMNQSVYDNSWDVYSQDMPTAEYLLKNKVEKVVIVSDKIREDINKILYSYKAKGLEILYTDGYTEPVIVKLNKPKKEID